MPVGIVVQGIELLGNRQYVPQGLQRQRRVSFAKCGSRFCISLEPFHFKFFATFNSQLAGAMEFTNAPNERTGSPKRSGVHLVSPVRRGVELKEGVQTTAAVVVERQLLAGGVLDHQKAVDGRTRHGNLVPLENSTLLNKIYWEEYGSFGGKPYGLLVSDYEFGRSAEDIRLLTFISQVAYFGYADLPGAGCLARIASIHSRSSAPPNQPTEKPTNASKPLVANSAWTSAFDPTIKPKTASAPAQR
jgi:hypothetical protein